MRAQKKDAGEIKDLYNWLRFPAVEEKGTGRSLLQPRITVLFYSHMPTFALSDLCTLPDL